VNGKKTLKGRVREGSKGENCGGDLGEGAGDTHHTAKPREERFWHLNTGRKGKREREKHVA